MKANGTNQCRNIIAILSFIATVVTHTHIDSLIVYDTDFICPFDVISTPKKQNCWRARIKMWLSVSYRSLAKSIQQRDVIVKRMLFFSLSLLSQHFCSLNQCYNIGRVSHLVVRMSHVHWTFFLVASGGEQTRPTSTPKPKHQEWQSRQTNETHTHTQFSCLVTLYDKRFPIDQTYQKSMLPRATNCRHPMLPLP